MSRRGRHGQPDRLSGEPLDVPEAVAPSSSPPAPSTVLIRDVKRTELPDGVRITLELDAEATFHSERVENPDRVFFDLKNASTTARSRTTR